MKEMITRVIKSKVSATSLDEDFRFGREQTPSSLGLKPERKFLSGGDNRLALMIRLKA
jgi:hypothetical protein